MASLTKTYTKEKLTGQVYTPAFIVCKILDDIGYDCSDRIIGKKIIDPACGDGRFLVEVVRRIIKYVDAPFLTTTLNCVYGWDIDPVAVQACIENLDAIVKPLGIEIDWKVKVVNALEKKGGGSSSAPQTAFDYIVGNPPYIRIQHLEKSQRQYIQSHYAFCKSGSTDIYIAFYELATTLLKKEGLAGFITPNTFLYTATAQQMRQYFLSHRIIRQITNYKELQIFENATTYSAIVVFGGMGQEHFTYQEASDLHNYKEQAIDFKTLDEPFWQLSFEDDHLLKGVRLKDICSIHVGLQTLCDKAYILKKFQDDGTYFWLDSPLKGRVKIEKEILRPIVKVSKIKHWKDFRDEYILFPYQSKHGKPHIISETDLENRYPLAYEYLKSVKPFLDKRDNGKPNPIAWYAFGRSQGLETSFGEKVVFSPMNKYPNFIHLRQKDLTFYSGYCIKYQGDISKLVSQLNSDRMQRFVSVSSRDFRSGWKAYSKKVIAEFVVEV